MAGSVPKGDRMFFERSTGRRFRLRTTLAVMGLVGSSLALSVPARAVVDPNDPTHHDELPDNLGTIRDVAQYNSGTNTTSIVDHLKYDSFGNIVAEVSPTYGDRFKFTAREWDAELEQYYYRARWYDAKTGTFLSPDPIGFRGGDLNLVAARCGRRLDMPAEDVQVLRDVYTQVRRSAPWA